MRKETDNTSLTTEAVAAISVSQLLNPAAHFNHPNDVLAAAHLDTDEKRAILASWASDQYAVESVPALRHYPGTERAVSYDEILQALQALDKRVTISNQINARPPDNCGRASRKSSDLNAWPFRRRSRVCFRGAA